MILRLIIILFVVGGILIFIGVRDYLLLSETQPEPTEINLAQLENDPSIDNNHILIGPHIALYSASIFEYEYDEWGSSEYTEASPVNYTFYPVISESHPYFEEILNLELEYGTIDDIPDEEWPIVEDFAVLIKTTEFSTVGDIPDSWIFEENAQGIVINKIKSLDSEEKELMQESFPLADMDSVILLDKGRIPENPILPYLMIGGGILLIIIAIGVIKKTNDGENNNTV